MSTGQGFFHRNRFTNGQQVRESLNEAKHNIKQGGCLSQERRSAIAKGEKPTPEEAAHIAACKGSCPGYISRMKEILAKEVVVVPRTWST